MASFMRFVNRTSRCFTLYRNNKLEDKGINGYQHLYIIKICKNPGISQEELVREIVNLLINTDKTMQAIADELHFSDQAVLTKFFRRIKGVSPLQYRNGIE